jgi:hypothetical protein
MVDGSQMAVIDWKLKVSLYLHPGGLSTVNCDKVKPKLGFVLGDFSTVLFLPN